MSDTIIEEQPAEAEEATPVEVADLSTAQLEAYLSGGESPAPQAEEPQAEEPQAEEPQAEEPQAEESAGDAPLNKQRIRPRAAQDQQVIDLYKSEGFAGTFQEAVEVIYGKDSPSPAESQSGETPPAEPDSGLVEKITDLRGEVGELESKIDEAAEEMETSTAMKLQRELQRKESEILRLEMQQAEDARRAEEAQYNTYRQRAVESQSKAVEAVPALADENSVTRKQFDAYVEQKRNDPDYAPVFGSPKWPELLAREFASNHPQPAQAQAEPVRVVAQNPSANTHTRVLTSADAPSQTQQQKLSADAVLSNLDKVSTTSLYDLLGGKR